MTGVLRCAHFTGNLETLKLIDQELAARGVIDHQIVLGKVWPSGAITHDQVWSRAIDRKTAEEVAKKFNVRVIIDRTQAEKDRATWKEKGKFAKAYHCEYCGKKLGFTYYSVSTCNETGVGLICCKKCAEEHEPKPEEKPQ